MSSAEANTVAIREIEAEPAPTRFARGWHCLGLSRDFKDGNPHGVRAFGQKLVVFCGSDGKLNVLDGYCRHMGGDLARARSGATRSRARFMTGAGAATAGVSRSRTADAFPGWHGRPPGPRWNKTGCCSSGTIPKAILRRQT